MCEGIIGPKATLKIGLENLMMRKNNAAEIRVEVIINVIGDLVEMFKCLNDVVLVMKRLKSRVNRLKGNDVLENWAIFGGNGGCLGLTQRISSLAKWYNGWVALPGRNFDKMIPWEESSPRGKGKKL